jgi:hypothetical protein
VESSSAEQAARLAETALGAAQQALETARIAERAAVEAAGLAMVALNAAGMAYEHADEVRGGLSAPGNNRGHGSA